ncbi:MAG: hypothetical protein CMI15_16260 [Opitutaceae bacterium]|nr:hypothetical protein [Opitutaceae bacterium]|tara:strand:- start:1438 stop:1647 length:210 start_codon:yes stop_codon:yes gene_type:complete
MTLQESLNSLHTREDWDCILDHIKVELETAMLDFQTPELLDNPQKLARLAGEISAFDRLLRVFSHAEEE